MEFAPGSRHTATLPVAVAPAGLACEVELWLSPDGETKSASSGLVLFTSTGAQQQLSLAVDMPSQEATYQVLVDIYCEGTLIGAYQALENISIVAEKPQLAISELFIGTRLDTDKISADDRIYVGVRNLGAAAVTGVLHIYDWQAWWGQAPGDDRHWRQATFTIPAGGIFRYAATVHHLTNDETYFRVNVVVNNAVVLETPRLYIEPGKQFEGEDMAVGECTYKARGLAVLWYSQDSECNTWEGTIHTPEFRPFLHDIDWGPWRTGDYGTTTAWWPAVFIPIIDPNIIAGATYYAYICGGGAGAAWRACWFNFVAA